MTISGLAESFKTKNRPDPTVTLLNGLFLEMYRRYRREILTQFQFKSPICAIKVWDRYL